VAVGAATSPRLAASAGRRRAVRRRPSGALGRLLVVGDLVVFVAFAAIVGLPGEVPAVIVLLATVVGWGHAGLYRFRCSLSVLDDLPKLLRAVLVAIPRLGHERHN
jgi:hypothetical protein